MRKWLAVLITAVMFAGTGLVSLSFAQGMERKTGKGMMKSDMMDKGEMTGMHGLMMKGMMERSIVATTDGGVIVLAGNKLIKYDKDLNVVREVEVETDMGTMQKKMMKNCSMMKGGMMGACMAGSDPEKNTSSAGGTEGKPEQKK